MGLAYNKVVLKLALVAAAIVGSAMGDSEKDREECAEQLVGLATCLPYVGGDAKSPTPDCCNGLKQVLKNDKKCLCVIVKDRNDPQLGLKINVTLALGLPSVCHASANVSQCPALLHLPPDSPDAQVFYQFAKSNNQISSSPAPTPTGGESPTSGSGSGEGQNGRKISSGSSSEMQRLGIELILFFSFTFGFGPWMFI